MELCVAGDSFHLAVQTTLIKSCKYVQKNENNLYKSGSKKDLR